LVRGFLVVFQPWLASSAQEWLEGLNLRPAVDGFIEKARQTVADQKDDWGRHEPKPGTFATDDPPFISILLGTLGNHKRIAKPLVEARNGAPMTQWEISYFSGYLMIFWCFVVGSVGSVMSSSFGTLRTIIASYPPRCGSSLDNSWLHGRSEYSEFS
jgi:hypothetical protein